MSLKHLKPQLREEDITAYKHSKLECYCALAVGKSGLGGARSSCFS